MRCKERENGIRCHATGAQVDPTTRMCEEHDPRMAPLPETVRYDMQPYTFGAVLGDLRWVGEYYGHPLLRATVLEGTERSRLFQHTATRDISGDTVTLYGVRRSELERGLIRRVAS